MTKFAPHKALNLNECGKLTFDESVVLHCAVRGAGQVREPSRSCGRHCSKKVEEKPASGCRVGRFTMIFLWQTSVGPDTCASPLGHVGRRHCSKQRQLDTWVPLKNDRAGAGCEQ